MGKKKKIDKSNEKTVKSVNNGIRSSVRKLNPILKSIVGKKVDVCLLYTSPSPRDYAASRMPSSA